jgi:hypothetical protein
MTPSAGASLYAAQDLNNLIETGPPDSEETSLAAKGCLYRRFGIDKGFGDRRSIRGHEARFPGVAIACAQCD